jgi:hypothetical protein
LRKVRGGGDVFPVDAVDHAWRICFEKGKRNSISPWFIAGFLAGVEIFYIHGLTWAYGFQNLAAVQAINQHRDVEAVQISGLEALRGLMAVPQGRTKVLRGGGAEAILAAMQAHPASAAVQVRGCSALSCLCAADYMAPKVVRLGGVEVILDAMKQLRGVPEVQEAACGTLWLLSALDCAQAAFVSANGIPSVMGAMAHCKASPAVQRDGCKILWRLASDAAHAKKVAASGAPQTLLEAVQSCTEDGDVPYYGKLALRTLAAVDPSAAGALNALATTA